MADYQDTKPKAQNKGGGFRGGPKRWTGRGPPPARHIPWPEIFKHHISLIEGHQKMIDMVRKHTAEGTGNHRQICAMIDRCKTMMYDAKSIARSFVPPSNQRDKVPLGSSSASMYPGYSPADHIYGQAAMEFGSAAAKAKAEGIELKPEADIEYEIGQGKGIKRRKLAEMNAAKATQDGNTSASGTVTEAAPNLASGKKPESEATETKEAAGDAQPSFYIDTNPTPVNLPLSAKKKTSKHTSPEAEPTEEKKSKKAKKAHEDELPAAPLAAKIETEDISAEVDARMKEKEEKRRKKEERRKKKEADAQAAKASEEQHSASADDKKRKRESDDVLAVPADASAGVGDVKKPKKKKSKKEKDGESSAKVGREGDGVEGESKKRLGEEAVEEGKKKKQKRKGEGSAAAADA